MVTRDTPWPDGTPCWVDLGTNDIPKAISFYSSQFGWNIEPGGQEVGGYSMAKLDGRHVAAVGPLMGPPGTQSAWATYFASSDVDATAAKIKSAGGQLLMEPMDVMDAGRMLVAADTTGASFGVWQGGNHTGAEVVNVPGAFTWSEHMSRDFEGAKAFYAAVFGYEYGDMSSDGFSYATLLINGQQVVGGIGAYPGGSENAHQAFWGVYFGTADTDKAVDLATSHGGQVVRPASDSPYGRMAIVADNQGAVFSLISTPEDSLTDD
jgi:predicted enzyme related to lactoylglutathione lyase